MNPCVDAILYEVADPAQIVSISHYSHDARATSVPLEWAKRFSANDGGAEDVIFARPDLVLAGPHVSIETIEALERLHIPMLVTPMSDTVAGNKAQIAEISTRIGRVEQGRALNARIDSALAKAHWAGPKLSALVWQGGGLVPGKGTLVDELLAHTGFRNASSDLGLSQWDMLSLENLLGKPPQILLAGRGNMGESEGEASRMLGHPALRKAGRAIQMADFPSSLLNCGGPVIIRAAERMAAIRNETKR